MTRQYQIQKITGKPDWNKIEKAPIDQKLWLPCEQISAYAQLAYDDSRLYVRLHAEEPTIRAENTGILDQPCQDSCLEFFFSAAEQDARYINIELNPSLCIYFGFGTGREDLMRILLPDGAKDLACSQRKNAQWLGCDVRASFSAAAAVLPGFCSVRNNPGQFLQMRRSDRAGALSCVEPRGRGTARFPSSEVLWSVDFF